MPNAAKPGLAPLLVHPEAAPEAIVELGEASENTARRLSGGPAPNARFGESLQSATPQALGPSGPERRPSADPGNDAAASDRAGSESELAGAPSSARARVRRRGCSGDLGEAGPHRLVQPCSAARGAHMTPRPRKPGGTKSPRQAPPPRPRGLAPQAAPRRSALARHPTRSAIFTKAPRAWPKARRHGARDPSSRRKPPCPAPVRRTPQRPPCGARRDRQGLRPLRPGR